MQQRLGHLAKFILVLIALSACGGSGGSSSSGSSGGSVATELQTTVNGWSFPNYPSSEFPDTDFNETDLVSMFGSGEEICVAGVATPCKLTAEASAWARMVNQSRASGHCEGLVAIASTRFNNKETPVTVKLPTQSETLHAIMRAFATQFLPEVQDSITQWLNKSLEEKVEELKTSFAAGKLNYTLGVYTDGGGHAVLPYAIEYPTPSTPRILLYDSNWPGKNRYVDVDLKAKTWRFSFSSEDPETDTAAWTGGPQDMDLTPLSAREGTCPFCGDGTKALKTTMLIRSSNLDWSVETDGGVVSPENPVGTDGTSILPVKGAVKRDSYDYLVSVPTSSDAQSATTVAKKNGKKTRSKLKFSGSTSVYAMMPDGIAQFTTPGTSNNPVEIEGSSISTKDPGVDLTLASGNLVANASGAAISLSVSGGTMEVAVTTASGQVVQQQVSEDKPTLQMKADPTGGGITVLAASSTGVVEKTEVSSSGVETKTIVKEVLNLSSVKAELPPELASKEIAALPALANRNMANPNYKVDPVYTAPTTTVPKDGPGGVVKNSAPQVPTVGKLILPVVEFGDAPFTAQAPTSNSKGEWKFTSSKTDIAQINASTGRITVVGAGTTTITATQAATKDYETISVTADLTVERATPVLGAFTTTSRTVGEEAFVLASPTSTNSAVFKMESSDESVAKFSKASGKLLIVGAGKTTITASQPANDNHLAASKSFVLIVRKGTPVLTATADLSSTFGEDGPTITKPTSESRGAISFASSNAAVATVNATTGQVTVVGAGTSTITITQAATDDYVSATQTLTFTVKQATPALGKLTTESKKFGDAEFTIEKPTSPSSGAFTFTSSDSKIVKISEAGKATIEGVGTVTITATQAAEGNYSANSVTAEIAVSKAAPVLSNISLTDLVFGDADTTMEPRSTSTGAFTFSSNKTDVLTVNEKTGLVRIVSAGTATITVKQASTTNYEAASSSVTVQVGLATPAFQRLEPLEKQFGDATFLFDWGTSPSDGVISYTSSSPTVATINATTGRVTIVSTGVTTLTMSQAKGTNHKAATSVVVLTVSRGLPVYGDFVIDQKTFGAAPFLLTSPTTTSTGAFTFTSSNTSVATVNSATGLITVVAPGSTEITANQAQTLTHTASSIRTTFVVDPASPTFGSFVAASKTFGDATFIISAPSSTSSGVFTFTSSNAAVATINSSTGAVTIVGAGSTTITASQAAASPYATQNANATLTIAKATPSLSGFGSSLTKNVGDASFTPTIPSSASTGAITYSSSNTAVATINSTSGLISVLSGGSTTITATQAATDNYNSTTATTTLTVLRDPMLGAMAAITKAYGSAAFTLTAPTSNSNGAITYTSSNTAVATINSSTRLITITGSGTTTITASQVATSTYTSASTSTTLTVEAAPEITQLSLSNISSCALTSTGAMKCWGSNSYGQIGTLASGQQKTPIDVPGFTINISAIAVGDTRMCALTTTGEVKCIGNGVANSNTSGITSGAISISSGYANSCALMSYGGVKCWGDNWTGQLGDGTWVNRSPAVNVKGLTSGVTAITSGIQFTCALLSGGSVKCWGANNYGQLGDGTTSNRNEPTQVSGLTSGVVSISGGYEHTCAVLTNGEAKCWGRNGYGELGDGTTTNRSVPTSVKVNGQPIFGIASISGGLRHTCVITTGGAAKCWGFNGNGSLGNGTIIDSLTPVDVVGLDSGVLSIDAGKSFTTCATVTGASVKCWGGNWAGNVGDGYTTDRSSPVNVVGLMSSSPSATTLGALTLPSSSYTTSSADFTLAAPTSSRPGAITFASSNPAVATVDAATGLVQIKGIGTAVLAAAIGGNGQYRATAAQVTITVGS